MNNNKRIRIFIMLGLLLLVAALGRESGGVLVTFKSCGYQATGLFVKVTNMQTGQSGAEILAVSDTSPAACASRLYKASMTAGYSAKQEGDTVRIFGTRIQVETKGPVIEMKEF